MNIDDVLGGLGGLEGIQRVLSGPASRGALRAALRELLEPGQPLGACRLRRAKYRTGRRLTAYYEVNLGDQRRPIAVTWTPGGAAPAARAADDPGGEREAIERGLASPFRSLVAEVGSPRMRIQVAPADAEFPQLARVSDPAHVPTMLVMAGMGIPAATSITAVRYRPGRRHVLRYDTGQASVYAKCYRDAERAARAQRIAVGVADRLAEAAAPLRAVRPLAAIADDAVVLYPKVAGTPLSGQLARRHARAGQHLRAIGVSLRALHRDPGALAADTKSHSFAGEVKKVTSACEHLHTLLPEVGRRVATTLDRARELHGEVPGEPATFVYGDLKADHVWVTHGGLALIDFDTCYVADPALDVGKFLADLQWWHDRHDRPGSVEARAHFLDAYQAPGERLLRACVYEALILIKITAHRVRLFERDWPQRTARLIDRAQGVLEEAERRIRRSVRVPAAKATSS